MFLENAFLGQKGRKIYVEAQNARETSQKAEFEGEKPSCGMKNEKGGRCGSDVRRWFAFLRESAKGGLKRRAACAPEQIGTETERISAETERIGTETERIGAQAERVGGNILADHAAKQQAIAQDSEEAAPRARVARALCVCDACATRAQCAFRAEILMEEAREKHKRKVENGKCGKNRMNLHKRRRASVQKRDKNGKIWEIRRRHDKGWVEVARDHADGDGVGADGGEAGADCIELGADEIGTAQFSARSARHQAVPRRNR